MDLIINVTRDILEKSKNCMGNTSIGTNCAVALAIRDLFPEAWVDSTAIVPYAEKFTLTDLFMTIDMQVEENFIPLPGVAIRFIEDFDIATPEKRATMPEISFIITIPDAVIERIDISEVTERLKDHPTLELI